MTKAACRSATEACARGREGKSATASAGGGGDEKKTSSSWIWTTCDDGFGAFVGTTKRAEMKICISAVSVHDLVSVLCHLRQRVSIMSMYDEHGRGLEFDSPLSPYRSNAFTGF